MRSALLAGLLLSACSSAPGGAAEPERIHLTGTITWEGHFDRPHAARTIPASVLLTVASERARCELHETWTPGRAAECTVIEHDADGCRTLAPGSTRFASDRGEGERLLELLVATTRPGAHPTYAVAWQHPRLGDVEDYAEWCAGDEGPELRVVWHRAHDQSVLVLGRAPTTGVSFTSVTTFHDGAVEAPASPPPAAARFATVAPGVHELVLRDAGTRSLVVEFDDHVVLCETSVDNGAGERLLAAIDEHLPGKPVRWVLFGHYHPHYTGGLRPVLARGATAVAPPLGAAFAAEIAARPFRSPPDVLAASGRTAAIEAFVGQRTFRDDTNELVAIDIGASSHHTDEYVVFHLPRQRLLFQGDLGWFGSAAGPRAGGDRARGLLQTIDQRGLDVETLVQGWPAQGRGTMSLADLRALAAR